MLTFLLKVVFVIIFGYDAFLFFTLVLGIIDPKKIKPQKKKNGPDLNTKLKPLFQFIGRFLYMEENKERAQTERLQRAGINLTPREVMARSILGAVLGLLVCLWGATAGSTLYTLLGVVLGVALFGMSSDEANKRLKEKDAEVKKELPKFVSTIIVSLRTEKNIIRVIESYIKDAKPALRSDLEVLLSQMTTGNIETALRNFDARMGAQEISSLVTSLIYIENGVDQTAALQYLESDMRQAQAALRRSELDKLPGKMRASFTPVAVVLIVICFYAILMQIFSGFTLFL